MTALTRELESTEETRRRFRELMFTTDHIEQWVGGVILYDETIRQSTSDGTPIPQPASRARNRPRHQGRHRRDAVGRLA